MSVLHYNIESSRYRHHIEMAFNIHIRQVSHILLVLFYLFLFILFY
jgi:hypothetical protein